MKNILLVVAIASLALVSCKKDRVCNCKYVQYENGQAVTVSQSYDVTLTKTSYRTAFRACTHTKKTYVENGKTYEDDMNCELK